jgi:hypothetical protein
MIRRYGGLPWWVLGVVAGALAVAAAARWVWAITLDGPVLYGEGAVAHAAILARDRLEYVAGGRYGDVAPIFTAANYPPLFFHLAGVGDPFIVGRFASGAATLSIATAIAWRARAAGPLVAGSLGVSWLATLPLIVWGVAVKPDLVALGLAVGTLIALERRTPLVAGVLVALASAAKPTELLPAAAFAATLAFTRQQRAVALYAAGFLLAAIGLSLLVVGTGGSPLMHVVAWNALAFHVDQAVLLAVVAIIVVGIPLFTLFLVRSVTAYLGAYLIAATAIVLLGGREGATINYLIDLVTGSFLALAAVAPRLRRAASFPIALAFELVVVVALFDPFGFVPGRAPGTGAWADSSRLAAVRAIAKPALVEDSGLLVASGSEPLVDDLFLWSRLHDRDGSFGEGPPLLDAVKAHTFATIVSEADLAHLDAAPAYERQRWAGALVSAVLDGYRLDRREGALWVYVPR